MPAEWQIKRGDKVHGPFSDDQLRQLLRTGRIDSDTPVRRSENSIWRKAGDTVSLLSPQPASDTTPEVHAVVDQVTPDRKKPVPCQWQVLDDDRVLGPFSNEDIQWMVQAGQLTADHAVRQMGKTSWKSADQFSELFPPAATTKPCPYCAEPIQPTAVKCKHCGEFLDGRKISGHPPNREVVRIIERPTATWNPGTAAVLSFLIPGLGQMYKGQIFMGFVLMTLTIFGYVLLIVPGLLIHVAVVFDAYSFKPPK